jgi:soluble lytic murein transglycosylase-like protein
MLGCVGVLLGCAEQESRQSLRISVTSPTVRCVEDAPPEKPRGRSWAERRLELLGRACFHRHGESVSWRLGPAGVEIRDGGIAYDRHVAYRLARIAPIWEKYGSAIEASAWKHNVPAELILAVIVEESSGDPLALRHYPGYRSDQMTPQRISIGLGQMLLSTARSITRAAITRTWLIVPENAIELIALYLSDQYPITGFDPPLAAAAYNAGSFLVMNEPGNRWRLHNAPYIESFIAVSNAAQRHLEVHGPPETSLAAVFARRTSLLRN